jgi:hypothetical protein
VALPVVEDSGQILARDACHGGKIVLPDLLTDDDPTGRDLLPEMIRQLQHRPRDPIMIRAIDAIAKAGWIYRATLTCVSGAGSVRAPEVPFDRGLA